MAWKAPTRSVESRTHRGAPLSMMSLSNKRRQINGQYIVAVGPVFAEALKGAPYELASLS